MATGKVAANFQVHDIIIINSFHTFKYRYDMGSIITKIMLRK